MKKAFTLLELVFVIVVIGILAATIIPNTRTNPVQEAAIQLVSHIRYTQHLAMMDDRFDSTDATWFQTLWQIRFTAGILPLPGQVAYGIFSDTDKNQAPTLGGNVAVDPQSGLLMTGGVTNALPYSDDRVLKKANLGMTYGITSVTFGSECNDAMRIAFDNLGRPIEGDISSANLITDLKYITGTCQITISNGTNPDAVILIEPETGYTHIQ